MKYIILTILFLCSACGTEKFISTDHHRESKYYRFMQQCDDWDYNVCLQRYNQMAVQ